METPQLIAIGEKVIFPFNTPRYFYRYPLPVAMAADLKLMSEGNIGIPPEGYWSREVILFEIEGSAYVRLFSYESGKPMVMTLLSNMIRELMSEFQ